MRFWDSSAIVPLLVVEPATQAMQALHAGDPVTVVWWATEVECLSALARRERMRPVSAGLREAFVRLDEARREWQVVEPGDTVRRTAGRLVRTHDLRAADALQLAAAVTAAEGRPETLELVTLDDRLAAAADREGFHLTPF